MFRSFIYLDEEKLYTYKRQLEGKNAAQPKAISQKKAASFNAGTNGVGISSATEINVDSEFERDVSFDYDCFEQALNKFGGEEYFDCVLNDDYDLMTIPAMKLFRICSPFEIPEGFDMVTLIEQFKPLLLGEIETKSTGEQEALEGILGRASADIPFIIEYDNIVISGKLNNKKLLEAYENLEEYMDQDVYMLCKVVGVNHKETVEIFDPLKDFIRLPRRMRREMDSKGTSVGLDKISVEGPVLKVEVVAIYK